MDIKDFVCAIEPLQATTAQASPEEDLTLMSLTSLALSGKRQADALERIAQAAENIANAACGEFGINVSAKVR